MVSLSVPGILGMVLVSLNSLVDAFFVSHLVSSAAFAGVSLTLPLFTVNSAITGMLSSGAAALYSRAIGSKDRVVQQHLFTHLLVLVAASSIILAVLGWIFGQKLLHFLGAAADVLHYGTSFYNLSAGGYFTSMLGLCTSGLIRAEGNIRYAMKVTGVAVLLNVLLNPLLIKYGAWGVRGSALATIISMSVYSFLNIRYFLKGKGYLRVSWRVRYELSLLLDILRTGLPSFFMQINGFFRQFILFKLVAYTSAGITALTTFNAIYRLFSFAALPVFGLLQAYAPVIGINFGAGYTQRVKQTVRVFRTGAFLFMLVMALPGLLFPQMLLQLLVPDAGLLSDSSFCFRMVLCVLPLMPFASTSIVFLQSTGNSRIASRISFSRELLLFIPILLLSVSCWGYRGIYYGLLLENIAYMLLVSLIAGRVMKQVLQQPAMAS